MSALRAYVQGSNLGLAVGLAVVVVAVGGVALGPLGGCFTSVYERAQRRLAALEQWRDKRERLSRLEVEPPRSAEPLRSRFFARVAEVRDEPELLVSAAQTFDRPGVRALSIERARLGAGDDGALGETVMRLEGPGAAQPIRLVAVPLRVAFRADFGQTLDILETLESHATAFRVEAIDLERRFPDLAVRFELTYFVRQGGER